MITRFLTTHALRAALLVGSFAALTNAANAQSPIAKISVPFEFAAGGAMMPAGEYTVDISDVSGVILLQGAPGNSVALISIPSTQFSASGKAKLIFQKRDGMAYLSTVEFPDQSVRVSAPFQRVTKGATTASLH